MDEKEGLNTEFGLPPRQYRRLKNSVLNGFVRRLRLRLPLKRTTLF